MNRKRKIFPDRRGITLVEVMAAASILVLASGIIMGSILFCSRMEAQRKKLQDSVLELGKMVQEDRGGTTAVLNLEGDGVKITGEPGRVYEDGEFSAVWTDGRFSMGFYEESGLEELPVLTEKSASSGLPKQFPDLRERTAAGFMEEAKEYWSQGEDGSLRFSDGAGGPASWAELDGISVEKEGNWTASGPAVLDIPAGIAFRADRTVLYMGAEIYRLAGTLSFVCPEKDRGGILPLQWYLNPESGHGQPALVFVEEGTSVECRYKDAAGMEYEEEAACFEIPAGWYRVGRRNLLSMTAGDWEQCRLEWGESDGSEIRKALVRMELAGLLDREAEDE